MECHSLTGSSPCTQLPPHPMSLTGSSPCIQLHPPPQGTFWDPGGICMCDPVTALSPTRGYCLSVWSHHVGAT